MKRFSIMLMFFAGAMFCLVSCDNFSAGVLAKNPDGEDMPAYNGPEYVLKTVSEYYADSSLGQYADKRIVEEIYDYSRYADSNDNEYCSKEMRLYCLDGSVSDIKSVEKTEYQGTKTVDGHSSVSLSSQLDLESELYFKSRQETSYYSITKNGSTTTTTTIAQNHVNYDRNGGIIEPEYEVKYKTKSEELGKTDEGLKKKRLIWSFLDSEDNEVGAFYYNYYYDSSDRLVKIECFDNSGNTSYHSEYIYMKYGLRYSSNYVQYYDNRTVYTFYRDFREIKDSDGEYVVSYNVYEKENDGEEKLVRTVTEYYKRVDVLVPKTHQHTYFSEYLYDAEHHWRLSSCRHDEKGDYAEHSYDADGKCTVCGYYKPQNSVKPNALAGSFTIDDSGTNVNFSKGNLYHVGTEADSGWGFEENQYDFRTRSGHPCVLGGRLVVTAKSDAGLFWWTPDNSESFAATEPQSNIPSDSVLFCNAKSNVMGSEWIALSGEQWKYLLVSRQNASDKWGLATITSSDSVNITGVVLLPDSWTLPSDCSFVSGRQSKYVVNKYSSAQWQSMEAVGAVFLPASGYISNSSNDVYGAGRYCEYWTNTYNENNACPYYLYFTDNRANGPDFGIVPHSYSTYGIPIRLVTLVSE